MRLNFAERTLADFHSKGSMRGISPVLAPRVRKCLQVLEEANCTRLVGRLPGTHKLLRGKANGAWAMKVSGAWRIVFRAGKQSFDGVELVQYH